MNMGLKTSGHGCGCLEESLAMWIMQRCPKVLATLALLIGVWWYGLVLQIVKVPSKLLATPFLDFQVENRQYTFCFEKTTLRV